jgi:outer membrane protein OmpA-like peptidoglycan-associated protein/tetratricopeptide (TPR) repeat protein
MKKILISIYSLVLCSTLTLAQSKQTKKADKLFNRFEYVAAAEEYLKLAEKGSGDAYVYKQLADAYYNTFSPEDASKWYAKAVQSPQDAETYYRYAQMLKAQGKTAEANKQMEQFAQKAPSDQRAQSFKANPNYMAALKDKQPQYDVQSLDVNSDKSDFGAVLHGTTIYFASARNAARKTYGWTDEPYLDIYEATYNVDGTVTNASPTPGINTKWHDGPATLSQDGNTMYYSGESFTEKQYEKDKEANARKSRVQLFKATKLGEKWGNSTPLPFNSTEYSVGNPSLSKDGKTLYFASDMPGGLGGIDIWKVSIATDGTFGTPQNLGSKVNTEGDESFPFITEDNQTLYFASKGRQGFGGYDVFAHTLATAETTNLGAPVNSSQDDFAFSYYKERELGFVSSNRNAGVDNIFKVTPLCKVEVAAVITDAKTGKPLSNAKVSVMDAKKNVITSERTTADGKASLYVICDQEYSVQASADGYEPATQPIKVAKEKRTDVSIALNPIEVIITETEVILPPIFFEFDKSNITEEGANVLNKLVEVMKANPNMVILAKSHTDNRGSDRYNLRLSDRRAQSTVQYLISQGISKDRISGKGMGESEPKHNCGENCTEEQHAENRRSEFLIVKK